MQLVLQHLLKHPPAEPPHIYTKKTLQNIHKSYRDYLEGTPTIDKPWFINPGFTLNTMGKP